MVVTTLDRPGRSTQNMLAFTEALRGRGAGMRVLNLGGGDVDAATPMGSMLFTVTAALAQMEREIERERITGSVARRRAAGKDLGGHRRTFTDSRIRNALRLIDGGESRSPKWHGISACREPPFTGGSGNCPRLRPSEVVIACGHRDAHAVPQRAFQRAGYTGINHTGFPAPAPPPALGAARVPLTCVTDRS